MEKKCPSQTHLYAGSWHYYMLIERERGGGLDPVDNCREWGPTRQLGCGRDSSISHESSSCMVMVH